MSIQERLDQLKTISEVAALAGLRGQIDDESQAFVLGFQLNDGRSQMVRVRPTMRTPDGQPIVSVESPCLVVKKDLLSGMSKERALDLLRMNESTPFARYGIVELEGAGMVVASIDHLLETLDPDELKHSAWCVAIAADKYEEITGKDVY